ncbi:BAG family molecular chaperone regulator 6-like protein isoform X6 [Cinnamomum micranthum f. kanehirae]|uniref:BAG family molecular chaperone regulator 6-like protein isoform X6 n=1 Tax=Cinnamomum micranthum f. kanehirae TaxID=337451 RepID=A0A3S3QLD2_9MAGN|nr:BAG family molecular chaperone regulator 6-like protein isoform X6 [Cinnamomum micranthum f. kanehirae]
MTSPFFLNYINTPRRPRSQRRRRPAPNTVGLQHSPPIPIPVPIPVRFVGSDTDRSEAATKIQKLFRSFTVRKNVKKIVKIKFQVEKIHSQISHDFDLVERDAKERLRLSEKLMSLLFRLDSVSGIDPAVRDCRKAVICRAVALQEALDTIFDKQEAETETETASDFVHQTLETEVVVESNRYECCSDLESQTLEAVHAQEPSGSEAVVDDCKNTFFTVDDQALEIAYTDEKRFSNQQDLETESKCMEKMNEEGSVEGRIEEEKEEKAKEEEEEEEVVRSVEESKGVKEEEVVEKEREENEKLKGMVEELCEWNEVQSRLIEALSQRVDKLEETVARSERLRKKKKKMLVRWIA